MSRQVLIVEPDERGRAMMDLALASQGYAPAAAANAREARPMLDRGAFELVIVDAFTGRGTVLDDVRALRRDHPRVPLVVTGAVLLPDVLHELLRLGVMEALPKPFTPAELRDVVARVLARTTVHHENALDYAAAVAGARRALAAGALDEAARLLGRAQALLPFDAELMALRAVAAELAGLDDDAGRGYRAALALRHEADGEPPDPYDGLARLAAYGGARPTAALGPGALDSTLWIVGDPRGELARGAPAAASGPSAGRRVVVVTALGLGDGTDGTFFFRELPGVHAGVHAFALWTGRAPAVVPRGMGGPLVAHETTRKRLDLARLDALRGNAAHDEPRGAPGPRPRVSDGMER